MNKEELFEKFKMLFPDWAKNVVSYKKIGSKCLAIKFATGCCCDCNFSRVFLYVDVNNWQFGTKLYRKRPDKKKIKKEEAKEDEK